MRSHPSKPEWSIIPADAGSQPIRVADLDTFHRAPIHWRKIPLSIRHTIRSGKDRDKRERLKERTIGPLLSVYANVLRSNKKFVTGPKTIRDRLVYFLQELSRLFGG
jgi:hypothetical protein